MTNLGFLLLFVGFTVEISGFLQRSPTQRRLSRGFAEWMQLWLSIPSEIQRTKRLRIPLPHITEHLNKK